MTMEELLKAMKDVKTIEQYEQEQAVERSHDTCYCTKTSVCELCQA